jgi:hypothetical protein
MATPKFTCNLINDSDIRLTEETSGYVFHFRVVNGELDETSDRVEAGNKPDARPADFYRPAALLAAKECLDTMMPPQPTGWPLSHPEPRDS